MVIMAIAPNFASGGRQTTVLKDSARDGLIG
jgi:hypothetical protein